MRKRTRPLTRHALRMVETPEGPLLHKWCAGPCGEVKPVTAFYHNRSTASGYAAWCKGCEEPGHRVRTHRHYLKLKASGWNKSPAERERKARQRRAAQGGAECVYVAQLLDRSLTFKIGKTTRLVRRVYELRCDYGKIAVLAVIPTPTPRTLEQQLHAQLHPFRIYDGAKQTELFQVRTKRGQQALRALLAQYGEAVRALPTWEPSEEGPDENQGQLVFWEGMPRRGLA